MSSKKMILSVTENGIKFSDGTREEEVPYIVLCDIEGESDSRIVESAKEAVQSFLVEKVNIITDTERLVEALEEGNRKVLSLFPGKPLERGVSTLIAAVDPKGNLLLAGAGHHRLYGTSGSLTTLLFFDPNQMPLGKIDNLRVHSASLSPSSFRQFFVMSKGTRAPSPVFTPQRDDKSTANLAAKSTANVRRRKRRFVAVTATVLATAVAIFAATIGFRSALGNRFNMPGLVTAASSIERNNKDTQFKLLQSKFEKSSNRIDLLKEQLAKKEAHLKEVKQELLTQEKSLKMLSQSEKNGEKIDLKEFTWLKEQLKEMQTLDAQKQQMLQTQQVSIENLQLELKEKAALEKRQSEVTKALATTKGISEELHAQLNEMSEDLERQRSLTTTAEEKSERLRQQVRAFEKQEENYRLALKNQEHEVARMTAVVQEQKELHRTLELELNNSRDFLEVKEKAFISSEAQQQKQQGELLASLNEKTEALQNVKRALETAQQELENKQTALKSSQEQLARLESERNDSLKKFTALEQIKEEYLKQNRAHLNRTEQLTTLLEEQKVKRDHLEQQIHQMASLSSENDEILASMTKSHNDLEKKLAAIEQEKLSWTDERELLSTTITLLKKEKSSLNSENRSIATQLTGLTSTLDILRNAKSKLEAERQQAINLANKQENQLASLERKNNLLSKEQSSLKNEQLKLREANREFSKELTRLAAFEDRYKNENELRLNQENRFEDLAETIRLQREMLISIEQSREELSGELDNIKRNYHELLSEMAPQPASQEAIGMASLSQVMNKSFHIVEKGETLSQISLIHYGTANKWREIYNANKENISSQNSIKPGTKLIIP